MNTHWNPEIGKKIWLIYPHGKVLAVFDGLDYVGDDPIGWEYAESSTPKCGTKSLTWRTRSP